MGRPCAQARYFSARRPAHSHNAHSLGTATCTTVWHPLFGLALPIRRRQTNREGESLLCESPNGRLLSLPSWMCNPECLQFSLGSPLISVNAIEGLRALLDMCHTSSDCDAPVSRKKDAHEEIQDAAGPADESVAPNPGSTRNSRDQQKELTLALVELTDKRRNRKCVQRSRTETKMNREAHA